MDELFSESASRLAEHPKLGRAGKVPGTRELVAHEHYLLVYELNNDTVWILTLIHTARLWLPARSRVFQVAVSMNGIELQDREFFAAIREGRQPDSNIASVLPCCRVAVLPCYRVLHDLEQQLGG